MTVYRVNDIYSTIQGEGCQTGVAMVLLRLHGCPVGCPFCDTRETWTVEPQHAVSSIAQARGANAKYTVTDPLTIARYIATQHAGPKWIMLTGGEPAEQPLGPLVDTLHDFGYKVAIETSGTAAGLLGVPLDWVCVSPKIDMPGGRSILPTVVEAADEIKFVVGKPADLLKLDNLLASVQLKDGCQICLQPMSQNAKATQLCMTTVEERGWRLSIQVHKLLRIA